MFISYHSRCSVHTQPGYLGFKFQRSIPSALSRLCPNQIIAITAVITIVYLHVGLSYLMCSCLYKVLAMCSCSFKTFEVYTKFWLLLLELRLTTNRLFLQTFFHSFGYCRWYSSFLSRVDAMETIGYSLAFIAFFRSYIRESLEKANCDRPASQP